MLRNEKHFYIFTHNFRDNFTAVVKYPREYRFWYFLIDILKLLISN